jgi:L-amino acid N-acyltransferase YncA
MAEDFKIRPARLEDFEEIYDIFQHVLKAGDTYSYTPVEMTPERSLAYWISAPGTHCFLADVDGKVAGMASIRPNRTDRGNHVANASFIVDNAYRGKGIGRALGEHILTRAAQQGYKSIQFNFVVSTNIFAVKLWQSLGFEIIGTLPKGFQHANGEYVDVYIMHKFL